MTRRSFGAIRKLPSGRYQASHPHPDSGKRVNAPRTFPTRAEAAKWLRAADVDLGRGTWSPPAPKRAEVLFGTYAAAWLDRREPELKPRTITEYRRLYATTIEQTFGAMALDQIDRAAVRAWHNALDPAAPTQRARAYTLLRSILGAAVDDEILAVNPAQIRGAGRAKRAREIEPATVEQVAAIVAAMPHRWSLAVQLATYCGLRFGEVTELRRADVDLDAGTIRVRRAVSRVNGTTVVHAPKSADGVRTVAIPARLLPTVALHLDVYAGPELLFTAAGDPDKHVAHGSLSQAFQRARTAAGREDLHFHGLRHTGASWQAAGGAGVAELQAWLGHSTPAQSLAYTHVMEGRMRANADAMPMPAAA